MGDGATGGLTPEGIIIIAGQSTSIAKMKYKGDILIAIPNDFKEQNADILMKKEEDNLWKFKETGEKYSKDIAYSLLHLAIPDMVNGSIKELSKVVFDYRFNMGSIENCSFVYEKMVEQAKKLRKLYENNKCEFLALSSVGPAFFAIVNNKENKEYCLKFMQENNMRVIETKICNSTYKIDKFTLYSEENYWQKEEIAKLFANKEPSKYITDAIDKIKENNNIKKCIDIGCGGGRYSKYLKKNNLDVLAIDKYNNMTSSLKNQNIRFINTTFDNIPEDDETYDLALSIGVLHNATTIEEMEKGFCEMSRILKNKGYVILSIFTNDIISEDLTSKGDYSYNIINRPPMILLPKNKIKEIALKNNLKIIEKIDEHITDVGNGGKRYVYSILLQKNII